METILITGIGLIAKATGKLLSLKGYNVHYLTRNPNRHPALKTFKWNLSSKEIDVSAFKDVTTIIHLAGANMGIMVPSLRAKYLRKMILLGQTFLEKLANHGNKR